MSIFSSIYNFFNSKREDINPKSSYIGSGAVGYNPIEYDVFDGEKTPGELGTVYDTEPDHIRLRLRAYDLDLKTDIIKAITGKFFKWVIGNGLKLQYEPNKIVLDLSGIKEQSSETKEKVEALFSLYGSTRYSDYHKKDNLHIKAQEAFKAAFLGGDCLCVIRFDNKYGPNIQVIDGEKVETPFEDKGIGKGNTIKKGIEINNKGEHVAFWVATESKDSIIEHKRIKAENSNGNLVAWMIYGSKARIDHYRGIPVISSIIEKVNKLDRFVESSVKKAEETANVVYAFKHSSNSTGENILATALGSKKSSKIETPETIYEKNGRTANQLRQSTSGTVMNLTSDSDLISLHAPSEAQFDAFYRSVFVCLCASVDIPEEVALQKFDQNYSSSRAAINGWEFIVEIWRNLMADKFYKPFFKVCLEYWALTDKVDLKNLLTSKAKGDYLAVEAYFSCRFTGKKMPHIDPQKEAKAIRTMLGDESTPLLSYEQATELLGLGDWKENVEKYIKESKIKPVQDDKIEDNSNNKKLDTSIKK